MLRAFFKNITNLNGEMLGSAELKVNSGTISDDLLSKATSSFELVSIPPLIENGNVICIYDEYGQILFTGIINSIEGQSVTASNILAIFDDVWRYYDPALNTTIENCIEDILITDYKNSSDTLVSTIFNQFNIVRISATEGNLGLMGNNYTVNMYDYIMYLYEVYDILIDIYIPPSNGQSVITIGKPTFETIKVGNNTNAIKNIQITKEVQEVNRLVIYNGYGLLRGIWYATPSGITQNASALDRITKVKSEIVFSDLPDEDLPSIVSEHLSNKIYNHKITCELLIKNSLYNYKDFKLGTNIQVFFNGEYYDSILTGYSYSFDNRGVLEYMTLTMGKVRYSLADKLKVQKQEIGQIQNVQNEQVYVKQYVDREIGEISSTVASVQETVEDVQGDVGTLQGNVSTLQGDVGDLQGDVDELGDSLDGVNTQITTINNNVSSIQQTASNIQTQVTQTQTTLENDYATKEQLSSSVSSLSSTIEQTASGINVTISNVQSTVNSQGSQITTLETYIGATSRGLEIGRNTDDVKAVLGNNELAFYDKGNTKLAWLNSDEGLGATGLSIGNATTANQRWRVFTRQNGSHLTFTRHS